MSFRTFAALVSFTILIGIGFPATGSAQNSTRMNVGASVKPERVLETSRTHSIIGPKPEAYFELLKSSPNNPVILNNLGVSLVVRGRLEESLKVFQRALENGGASGEAFYNISVAHERLGHLQESIKAAVRAAKFDVKLAARRVKLCEDSLFAGQNDSAVKCYRKFRSVVELDRNALGCFGVALLRAGKAKESAAILKKVVQISPPNAAAFNVLGFAQYDSEHYPEAAKAFKRATELDPDRGEFRYNLAVAQLANHNRPAVEVQYELLLESDPKLAHKLYKLIYHDKIIFVEDY